jgi:hypothetical protein
MKTIIRLFVVSTLLLSSSLLMGQTAPSRTATVTATVNSSRSLSATERQELIEAAINEDPEIAADLIEALITAYPLESPDFTEYVVQAVIKNTATDVTQKSNILQAVAQRAVDTAIRIPASSVPNVVSTVNLVKDKLANVGAAGLSPEALNSFTVAVRDYIAPITELPTFENNLNLNQNLNNQELDNNDPQTIVSNDQP